MHCSKNCFKNFQIAYALSTFWNVCNFIYLSKKVFFKNKGYYKSLVIKIILITTNEMHNR